eukprot:TRINITY_DN1325_c0_g1_i3.p1 TRINITY_DN1325_c0_g1~~TRINITY_DN1325_c0_g1_i3.p1  ORF type:complete len:103 (-),score=5.33 TRINITY_DN1325_c0_g1_i3:327-635(-)
MRELVELLANTLRTHCTIQEATRVEAYTFLTVVYNKNVALCHMNDEVMSACSSASKGTLISNMCVGSQAGDVGVAAAQATSLTVAYSPVSNILRSKTSPLSS